MATILHVASSYPDPIAPDTKASSLLLELAPEFTHNVYTFKRAGWRGGPSVVKFDDPCGQDHRAIAYGAPPRGFGLKTHLNRIADWILKDAIDRGLKPDLIHAHKLTMDGLIAQRLVAHFKVPMLLTVQANTDAKIINVKRDLRTEFNAIWRDAAEVFAFAPSSNDAIETHLGARPTPTVMLPCPTKADTIKAPKMRRPDAAPVIRTAFNIAHYGNKNVEALIKAVAIAATKVPDIKLEIIGGGDAAAFLTVTQMAEKHAPGRVTMLGARTQDQMPDLLHDATAFALLSKRESYGMVFAESLLAGTPCLFPSGRAIDGYFEDGDITLARDPGDLEGIAAALTRLCMQEDAFKSRLAKAQNEGKLNFMRRDAIAKTYIDAVHRIF